MNSSLTGYDRILANRAQQRSFADLAEQRSAARQEAAQRTISQGETLRSSVLNSVADIGAGTTKLTEMMIRSRMAAEAKASSQPSKWYA